MMTDGQPGGTGNAISGGTFYGPAIQGRDIQVGVPSPAAQASSGQQAAGHVFISYVREDAGHVDRLQRVLQAAEIPVWRDTADLWPGEDWRAKIRAAITSNALVFLACFSSSSLARARSYQNEELVLAIEQLRQRPPEDPWLIPVRFDDCQIPDRDIGAGRTLSSIQRADLFGDHYDEATQRLIAAILRILGRRSGTMRLTITEPSALALNDTTLYRDLEHWLSHPVRRGEPGGSPAFPVRGRVEPPPSGGQIRIRMFTDQWYEQGKFLVDGRGNFYGEVYINEQRPQARLEITVVSDDGTELLQQIANLA
jgi:hypothetical protein